MYESREKSYQDSSRQGAPLKEQQNHMFPTAITRADEGDDALTVGVSESSGVFTKESRVFSPIAADEVHGGDDADPTQETVKRPAKGDITPSNDLS